MKAVNESHGARRIAKEKSSRWRVGLQLPRLRFGLLCGLLACLAVGCSRTPNAAEIEKIKALGGKVETDPADKAVVKVWLYRTDADDNDMQIVARCPKLRFLNLVGSQVTDEGIKRLTGLSELQTLDAYNTGITDAGVASLTKLPALTHLLIGKTRITDAALNSLSSLPNLQELRVEGMAITDAGMTSLAKLTQLRTLYLDDTRITDAGLEKLRGLKLEFLSLSGTQIDDRAVKTLSGFTNLTDLRLTGSRVSKESLAAIYTALPRANAVEVIRALGGRVDIDPADKAPVKVWLMGPRVTNNVIQLVARFPKLRFLNLVGSQVTDQGIKQLAGLSKLEVLDAYDTAITDSGVASLTKLAALTHLCIGKTKITDAALNSLTSRPNLHELRVEGTAITDTGVAALAKIPQLRVLYLDDTKITDAGLEKLRDPQAGAPKLEFLSLSGAQIDDRAVKTLSGMTSLKTLNVARTRLSREGAAVIRKALPNVSMDWPPAPPPQAAAIHGVIRIKAGSSSPFTDSSGNVWQAELGFKGGNVRQRDPHTSIANTKDAGLYLSLHFAMDSFSCGVPNGKYIAKLHFAETYQGIRGEGQRVFSFNVQGHEFKNFDMWKKAGGSNRAYIETVPVEVTDGEFKITFTKKIENPQINAIELAVQPD